VGMLAGENDHEKYLETGDGREINRHNYSLEEIEQAMNKEVVQRLLALTEFRNEYDAFNGDFTVSDSEENEVVLTWVKNDTKCTLYVDLNSYKTVINYVGKNGKTIEYLV